MAYYGDSFLCKTWGFHGGDYEDGVFWDVTPCGSCKKAYGGAKFLRNVGSYKSHKA
jgi:hypothetical protein